MNKIILTRTQYESIQKIFENFQDIDQFEIVQESTNGIGVSTLIKFDLIAGNREYDITDVSNW
jgi:hypothetical protein